MTGFGWVLWFLCWFVIGGSTTYIIMTTYKTWKNR